MATSRTVSPDPAPAPRRSRGLRARQADATREHLIDTAIGVLGERSYQGATVFEVAKAAGVTHGALQHHFGSKAMLMVAVIDAIVRDSGPAGFAWPDPARPLAERCHGVVQALWRRAYEPPRFLAAWAVYFGSAGEPELRSHVAQRRRELSQLLHLRFVTALPELAASADAAGVVQLVLSALRGIGVARVFSTPGPAEDAQLRLLGELLLTHCQAPAPVPSLP